LGLARGTKRKTPPPPDDFGPSSSSSKLSFSSKTVQELALKAEEAAMKQIELEQAAALKHKLPDFWLPSLTPTHAATTPQSLTEVDAGVKKLQTTCRGAAESHPIAFVLLLCLLH
jgi:nitric oxide synthase-interacting protein